MFSGSGFAFRFTRPPYLNFNPFNSTDTLVPDDTDDLLSSPVYQQHIQTYLAEHPETGSITIRRMLGLINSSFFEMMDNLKEVNLFPTFVSLFLIMSPLSSTYLASYTIQNIPTISISSTS
ncbi:unnamed protein product [Protopolystoma xenopodis]|uniref:Uncharacterized protein n=1 Tax=Protopolystoma xenopodis TaxID=117903 RepID=A0A448WEF7_9PLAT|nr:unnamed protein product [Protopolystoma xenopodis]